MRLPALVLALCTSVAAGLGVSAAAASGVVTVLPLAVVLAFGVSAAPAHAATKVVERVADGQVVSKNDTPISGAIVFLKDAHNQAIRTYICDQDGHFHFGQLAQSTDYEIWAESNGVRSHSKSISSFDSRNDYNFTLKISASK
jgi:hypothetical protein